MAAYEAARLGHKVILYEKEKETGGQIRFAAQAPYKAPYGEWIKRLTNKAVKLGVDLKTGVEVTETMIKQEKPEVVILATGGQSVIPPIEGVNFLMYVTPCRY